MFRVWAKFAVQAAKDIADATGTVLRKPDAFGCSLRPRWVDVTYQEKPDTKVKAEAEGWQWLSRPIGTILQLYQGTTHLEECSEEIS
eukprot:6815839-Pyramimonas_sp.AAC.1